MLSALIGRIEALARRLDATPTIEWGTVTGLDPLRVQPGGAAHPLPITPATIYRPRAVGERVLIVTAYRRAIVLGRAGGDPASEPGTIEIDGQVYATSGVWPLQTLSNPDISQPPVYAWALSQPAPYVPPVGWTFATHLVETNGYTFADTATYADGYVRIRVLNLANAAPTIKLGWRLVRAS